MKPARDEDALHLLRTDPAEYFRRRDEKAGWPPRASERVLIGGEPEDMYRDGDEIIVSGTFHIYVDEAVPLAIALLKVATGE